MTEKTITFRIPEPGDTLPFVVWQEGDDLFDVDQEGRVWCNGFSSDDPPALLEAIFDMIGLELVYRVNAVILEKDNG